MSSNDTPVVDELIDQSELAAVMNSGEVAEIQQTPGPFRRPRFLKKEDVRKHNTYEIRDLIQREILTISFH